MTWIYFLPFFFSLKLSLLFPDSPSFVSFSLLSIFTPPAFAYSSPPPCHLTHPFPSVSSQTSGCISPPAGCMTGEQVERRANDISLSPSLPASLSLSPHLIHCPARGPPQPSFQLLPILSDHIAIQICLVCIPPLLAMKVSPSHQGWKNVGQCSQLKS